MRSSGELMENVEAFANDLGNAGVAFAIVIGIPGVQSMRYYTNMARFGKPGLDEFKRQLRHLEDKVEKLVERTGG